MNLNKFFSKEKKAEFADEAFGLVIMDLFERAKASRLDIYQDRIEGYFYNSLRFSFMKIIKRELRSNRRDLLYENFLDLPKVSYNIADKNFENEFSEKFEKAWKKLGIKCQQLLWWKHVEEMDTDEIFAAKGTGERNSVIKQANHCKKQLKEIFNNLN